MFIEPQIGQSDGKSNDRAGWIEVICGSMFSGKTEELIRRLNRAKIAGQKLEIFKPSIDTRYAEEEVVSHNANAVRSTPVEVAGEIPLLAAHCEVVGIDEAQFFDKGLLDVCVDLANSGKRVIIAGLDMDFAGKPFGPMPELMAVAEYVTKVHAICMSCGAVAHFSHRLSEEDQKVLLGEKDSYEPLCRTCYQRKK
ncbi:MAG: thymidine kinase [Cyclobacteriaceae bacterium]|nr:thymidine kinase [Cyclobacteriaceae bacterium]MCH8516839.1 thymidine kinase [Cyclobacteriaceae bacterium]